jgi:hypothetical protein
MNKSNGMNGVIQKISLTAESLDNRFLDYENLNTDVIVRFDNGDEYIATFFSFKNLQGMIEEHKQSKEYFSEEYYRLVNAVLVNDFNNNKLLSVIEHMMAEGDFQLVFKKV